ncbi:hypothetical protein [Sphingorhabdus sp. EL138]|uniref:hypothetical protein n=1 Tax=Sphingorhabdus sp. EL138 TaxID=2073156 RepID=UPI000D686D7C|nr:hypothetical protein [Sphingorhabdus sp. EL138]
MKQFLNLIAASSIAMSGVSFAQAQQSLKALAIGTIVIPADTIVVVTPIEEITSKKMKEGTKRNFRVAEAVTSNGVTVIPLNAPVEGTVTWRTGKGIFGKSAKFEITFDKVAVDGTEYALRGKHRQEGRGNTAAALLVSGIITGKSAVMVPGQLINAFVSKDISINN